MTPTTTTEIDLVERCRSGDAVAYAAFVSLWGDRLLRIATVIAGDRARAEAAVRDACVEAWRGFPSVHSEHALQPWLLGLVAKAALHRAPAEPGTTGALAGLEPADRAAVALLAYAELPPHEVVTAMGWKPLAGVSRLRRALKQVKR